MYRLHTITLQVRSCRWLPEVHLQTRDGSSCGNRSCGKRIFVAYTSLPAILRNFPRFTNAPPSFGSLVTEVVPSSMWGRECQVQEKVGHDWPILTEMQISGFVARQGENDSCHWLIWAWQSTSDNTGTRGRARGRLLKKVSVLLLPRGEHRGLSRSDSWGILRKDQWYHDDYPLVHKRP